MNIKKKRKNRIYQMSDEPCKVLIKEFINNLEITKEKTSYNYISL